MKTALSNSIDSRFQNISPKIKHLISKIHTSSKAFTLIEILVAITILATLVGGVVLTLNPSRQINKAEDSARQADLAQIRTALDAYYQDNNCYPTSLSFGSQWTTNDGKGVYMKEVPQSPKCTSDPDSCYIYKTDTALQCPQWNVLFAKLSVESSQVSTCPLSSLSNCYPSGYSSNNYACTLSGAVDCSLLASAAISSVTGTQGNLAQGATPTPTPIPAQPPGSVTYNIGAPVNTNPYPYQATVMPLYQTIGNAQSIEVRADDTVGNITSVKVVLYSDGDARLFTLTRVAGTNADGVWGGQSQPWQVTDTYNLHYGYDIIVVDDKGNNYTGRIRVKN